MVPVQVTEARKRVAAKKTVAGAPATTGGSAPVVIPGMGPDAPIVINEQGAGQSDLPYRFDLIDGPALFEMAKVLDEGAKKYGDKNWRRIPDVETHLNHLISHAYAYLGGDRSDEHLSHIMCRAMFAQALALEQER